MPSFGALVVHGLFEHKGRHQDNVAWLEKLGIEAYTFDLPGHGGVGVKGHIESWGENFTAISKAFELAQPACPSTRFIQIGLSADILSRS